MCRYLQHPAAPSFVCLSCRTSSHERVCVRCVRPQRHVGRDFATPKRSDVQGWEAVAAVLTAGYNYDSCGCNGPGWRPKNRSELRYAPDKLPAKEGHFWPTREQIKVLLS